ncbi:MAG: hypothetical protein IPH87_27465 [Anaerolineae bacterium]|nr:hypothetical protein [Anaerolineae bacterium]
MSPDPTAHRAAVTGARAENLANLDTARASYPLLNRPGCRPATPCRGVSGPSHTPVCPIGSHSRCTSETDYRAAAHRASFDLTLRQFGVALGETGRIRTLRFDSVDVTATQEVRNCVALLLLTSVSPARMRGA